MTEHGVVETGARGFLRRLSVRGRIGFSVLFVWIVVALVGPIVAPFGEGDMVSVESFAYPPEAGFLGTDYLGRDLLSRLLYGARMTMGVAFAAACIACVVGVFLGFLAAIAKGWVDHVLSRLIDALLSFPSIILALIVIGGLGTSLPVVLGTVALIEATRVFRIARALALDIGTLDFVDAARARGENPLWIITREILPNAAAPLLADFGLRYTYAILIVSGLSFLGLGVQPPNADWGVMVKENIQGLFLGAPAAVIAAACIATVTISVNLVVDAFIDRDRKTRVPEMLP